MDRLDPLTLEVTRLFAAKEARRRQLATLGFPEKVGAVIRMQQMVAPILRARGKNVRVWHLQVPESSNP
jgi:hypothetical protein